MGSTFMDAAQRANEEGLGTGASADAGVPESVPDSASRSHSLNVIIRRIEGGPWIRGCSYVQKNTADDPNASGRSSYYQFGDEPGPFELSADIAVAAVATEGFEVDPGSRVKLLQTRGGAFVVDESNEGGEGA